MLSGKDILVHVCRLRLTKQSFTPDKHQPRQTRRRMRAQTRTTKSTTRRHTHTHTHRAGKASSVFFQTQTFHNSLFSSNYLLALSACVFPLQRSRGRLGTKGEVCSATVWTQTAARVQKNSRSEQRRLWSWGRTRHGWTSSGPERFQNKTLSLIVSRKQKCFSS